MEPNEVQPRPGHQRRQPLHELQRRHHQMRGPVAPGGLELEHHLPGGVGLYALVGERRAGDVAAKLLQRLAVVGAAAHGSVQAETVDIDAQRLLEVLLSGHNALRGQHLLPGARAEGDAVGTRRSLQRPERAGLVRITVVVGEVRRTLLFDQHPPTGEQLHHARDDLVQHRLQRFIGWRGYLHELRRAFGAAPVHAVQHEAVNVDVEVGGRAKSLYQRDRAAVGLGCLEARLTEQVPRHHAVHHLQHGRQQLGLCGQQQAQGDGQRQNPLAHRHVGNDVVDQVRRRLRHAPGAA